MDVVLSRRTHTLTPLCTQPEVPYCGCFFTGWEEGVLLCDTGALPRTRDIIAVTPTGRCWLTPWWSAPTGQCWLTPWWLAPTGQCWLTPLWPAPTGQCWLTPWWSAPTGQCWFTPRWSAPTGQCWLTPWWSAPTGQCCLTDLWFTTSVIRTTTSTTIDHSDSPMLSQLRKAIYLSTCTSEEYSKEVEKMVLPSVLPNS
ncbi:hypothetical protein Btru_049291 [Bulinus truncatus]|nr:hypothetical protein Btru_049291 [Bulinus truncatus]